MEKTFDEMFADELNAIFVPNTYALDEQKPERCRWNKQVECKNRETCDKCGWNPAVATKRSREIRRRMGLDG